MTKPRFTCIPSYLLLELLYSSHVLVCNNILFLLQSSHPPVLEGHVRTSHHHVSLRIEQMIDLRIDELFQNPSSDRFVTRNLLHLTAVHCLLRLCCYQMVALTACKISQPNGEFHDFQRTHPHRCTSLAPHQQRRFDESLAITAANNSNRHQPLRR